MNTLFTHRSEIVFFSSDDSWDTIKRKINAEKHSAYPVCDNNNLDDIIGIVLLKDLFSPKSEDNFSITEYIKKPVFLNENAYAYIVLELFKKEKMHYGIVVDEYGTTLGIVTMDDVVDALVGDVTEADQDEYQITARDDKSWFVDGQYSILDFIRYFDIELNEVHKSSFTTVAGLIIHQSHTLPDIGDKIIVDNYELEVIDKDGQRIDKILVTKL